MTSSEYRNTIMWTLSTQMPEGEDILTTARRIFNNLGVAFPQGNLETALNVLGTGDYMGWTECSPEQARYCANNGYTAIGIKNDNIVIILPDSDKIIIDTAVSAVEHSVASELSAITEAELVGMRFFAYASLLNPEPVQAAYVQSETETASAMYVTKAVTTCESCETSCEISCQTCDSCQTVCQSACQDACESSCQTGCQVSCQSCNTCQSTCETSCQTGCEVSCQSCDTCQSTCESSCQTGCQVSCQTCDSCQDSCEIACQDTCESSCQTGCQVSCQSCDSCQDSCEIACQDTCESSCQTGCQVSCQTCDACQSTCESSCQVGCQVACQTCDSCQESSQTDNTPSTDNAIGEETSDDITKKAIETSHGDPVDLSGGAHTLSNTVMTLMGGQRLSLTLGYHSGRLNSDSLGKGWYHNYEKHIEFGADEAYVYNNPNIYARYIRNADSTAFECSTAGKHGYVLTVELDAEYPYILDCNKAKTEYYNHDGKLAKIVDHVGFETTITYTASLITVTDMISSKHIYLEKNDNGKIVRVYDDINREAMLEYLDDCLVTIRDINGNCLYFTYDSDGRVLTGTDDTNTRYFEDTYDSNGRVASQKDGNGSEPTIFEYFDDGTRRVTNRNGDVSIRVFNEEGLLVSYTDENGNTKTYEYDDNQNIIRETDALGNSMLTEYNNFNKPTKITKKNGMCIKYEYDTAGNLVKVIYPDHDGEPIFETYVYNSRNQLTMHTNVRGTVTVYTYDENGMPAAKKVGDRNAIKYVYNGGFLVSETDAMDNIIQYEHNNAGFVSAKIDAHGNRTTFEYDNIGNILRMTDADGNSVLYSYDAIYQKLSHTDANGNATHYSYTRNMKPSRATLPNGSTLLYEYDGEDRLIKTTNRDGTTTYTYYDPAGRAISKHDHEGNITSFEYDAVGNVIKVINSNHAETVSTYDGVGNLLTCTDTDGNTVTYQYDDMSRVIRKIDALTGVTVYRYSKAGDLLSETDALGNTRTYTYDDYGNRLTICDANGNITSFIYNDNNNMIAAIDAIGNVTKYTYDCRNQLTRVTNAKNQSVCYTYDALGRQITVTDAKGNTARKSYDANGNVISITDAKGNVVSQTKYNELNLPSEISYISGNTVTYEYDSMGRPSVVTDSLDNTKQYTYNHRGQITAVIDVAGNTSFAEYDALGSKTAIVGPLGGSTRYTYDEIGRLIAETTTSGGSVSYTYNALNLKSSLTNARGQKRSFTYDAIGRIIGCTSEDDSVSYTYDANGNVLSSTDKNGTTKRKIDALNRVIEYEDTFGNVIGYRYDPIGNLSAITYPDGTEVRYEYDVNNNLVCVTDWEDRKTVYTYDENNRVIEVIKPDGSVTTTEYDDAGRVISTVEENARCELITGFEYAYDILGRVSSETYLDKNIQICYTYDDRSRVTQRTNVNYITGETTEETFTYDAAGNIVTTTDEQSDSNGFTYDTNNCLIEYNGNTVTYDADGNMTSAYHDGSSDAFRYDSINRLIGTNTNAYTYNAENVRIRNLCGDSETTYVYNTNAKLSSMLVKTTDGVVTKYVYGRGLIGEETNGSFKTYHFDYRGSTVAITDINGNVTDRFEYDTYGKLTSRIGGSDVIFLYNGRDGVVTDTNGLIYMRARYYSPELRRFVNADILAGDIANAVTLNRYAYANGNPVSMIDPRGLEPKHEGINIDDIGYNAVNLYETEKKMYAQELIGKLIEGITANFKFTTSSADMTLVKLGDNLHMYLNISHTRGDGNIEVSHAVDGILEMMASFSIPIGDNFAFDVSSDGAISLSYEYDMGDGYTANFSASVTVDKIMIDDISAELSISKKLENNHSISVAVGVQYDIEKERNDTMKKFGAGIGIIALTLLGGALHSMMNANDYSLVNNNMSVYA